MRLIGVGAITGNYLSLVVDRGLKGYLGPLAKKKKKYLQSYFSLQGELMHSRRPL